MAHNKEKLKELWKDLKSYTVAAKDARTPWLAKAVILAVAAYVASPVDLIPDFIPVLGYLDDLLVISFGIWLASKMIPPAVLEESRRKVAMDGEKPGESANLGEAENGEKF